MIHSLRLFPAVLASSLWCGSIAHGAASDGGPLNEEVADPLGFWDPIPESPSTLMPKVIQDDYWSGQFERVNREVSMARNPKMVFFGDSITWHWSLGARTGEELWKERFVPLNSVNMGNSGDITPVMLYRVTHGNLEFPEGGDPEVAVLLCGTNNFVVNKSAGGEVIWDLGADCPPEDVAHGARAIAQVFRRRLPHTRVIMLGILPVANSEKWAKCREVNALGSRLDCDPNEVVFVDLQDKFLATDGEIDKRLFTDGTHLTEDGYRVWADAIDPIVAELSEKTPLDPLKIMLIGGSITEGADSSSCYRRYLDGMLRRKGLLIDFIGSRDKHGDGKIEPDSYEFDVDHEGHWGKDTAWLAGHMPSLLEAEAPDVAVLHVGTEDVRRGQASSMQETKLVVAKVGDMLAALRAKNPSVKVALARIGAVRGKADEVSQLNAEIQRLAESATTAASPVMIADLSVGFDLEKELAADGVLPSPEGASWMAEVFAEVIQRLVDGESS